MSYVAVKGGASAIRAAHRLLKRQGRGNLGLPEIHPEQLNEQMSLGIYRIMSEASLYDRELAAIAMKQAQGDIIEAVFLLRAYRTTLPRFFNSEPMDLEAMQVRRRISSAFKDLPGGAKTGIYIRLYTSAYWFS